MCLLKLLPTRSHTHDAHQYVALTPLPTHSTPSLALAAGARVTPVGGGQSADAAKAEERRRMARTIDAYLQKSKGIDTAKSTTKKSSNHKRLDNALEVAVKSADTPFGGESAKRDANRIHVAQRGRKLLRGIHDRREKQGLNRVTANLDMERRAGGAAGGLLSTQDQAALLAELAFEEKEGEEGLTEDAGDDMDDVDDEDEKLEA